MIYMKSRNKKSYRTAFVLISVLCILLASLPLFSAGLTGGHDLGFHLYRIVSVSNAIKKGVFPVRIYEERFNYYGYGSPLFYCDFFLYVPAFIHNFFHLDYTVCWKIFIFIINVLTFINAYISFKLISSSAEIGLLASVLYSLSTYRLVDIYTRAAIGECCALAFIPFVLCGFEMLRKKEYKHWLLLAAGYTGVLLSHMLSFLMMILFGAVYCLLHIKEFLNKDAIASISKAAILSVGCTAWFLVPLISAMSLPIQARQDYPDFCRTSLSFSELFDFPLYGAASPEIYKGLLPTNTGYGITKTPGVLLLIGSIVFLIVLLKDRKEETRKHTGKGLLLAGWIIIVLMSDLMPWQILQDLPVFSFFRSFQFVWRFNMLVILVLSLCAAYGFSYIIKKKRALVILIAVLVLVFSALFYKTYIPQSRQYTDDNMPLLTDELYLFVGNDIATRPMYESNWDSLIVNTLPSNRGLAFDFSVKPSASSQPLYIDVPLNYYPGYIASVDGDPADVT